MGVILLAIVPDLKKKNYKTLWKQSGHSLFQIELDEMGKVLQILNKKRSIGTAPATSAMKFRPPGNILNFLSFFLTICITKDILRQEGSWEALI